MAQSYSSTGAKPTVKRDKNLANQVVYKDGYETHYDENGRVKYSSKADDPTYRGTTDKTMAENGYTTNQHMTTDRETMSPADLAAIEAIRAQGASGSISWAEANKQANAIRDKYGYGISQEGQVYNPEGLQNSLNAAAKNEATKYYDKATNSYKDMSTVQNVTTPSVAGANGGTQQTVQQSAAAVTQQPTGSQNQQNAGTQLNTKLPELPGLSVGGAATPQYKSNTKAPTLSGTKAAAPEYQTNATLPTLGGGNVAAPEYQNNAQLPALDGERVAAPEYQNNAQLPILGGNQVEAPQFYQQQMQAPEFDRSDVQVQQVTPYETQDYSQYLKDLYAANMEAELADLAAAYEANAGQLQRAEDKISNTYHAQQNLAAAQNALAQQAMNEYAAAAGLNTGTTGQMALAQSASLQGQLGSLGAQEAQAIAENQAAQAELSRQYELAIVSAKASGNTELANALYQEMMRQDTAKQNAYLTALEQANFEAQLQMQNQQNRNQLAQQEFSNAMSQQQYADQMLQQAYQNAMAQQQYADSLAQQNFQNQMSKDQYSNDLAQQAYQNAVAQQQYMNQMAQQNFQNQLTMDQYNNDLLQQAYQNAMAQQQYTDQMAQQSFQNQMAMDQYGNDLAQQAYQNAVAQQQYANQMTQQNFQNQLTMDQYGNDLLAQQYADQMAMQQYLNQLNQQNYENQFGQLQYSNQMAQQEFENAYLLQQYQDAMNQQAYENALAAQKLAASGSNSGSGNGTTSTKSNMTLTTAKAMMDAGEFTEDAVNTMLNAGFSLGYLENEYGYTGNAHVNKVPVTPQDYGTVQQESASGNYGPKFNVSMSKIQIMQQQGASQEELSATLLRELEAGNITLAGAESLMKALGI